MNFEVNVLTFSSLPFVLPFLGAASVGTGWWVVVTFEGFVVVVGAVPFIFFACFKTTWWFFLFWFDLDEESFSKWECICKWAILEDYTNSELVELASCRVYVASHSCCELCVIIRYVLAISTNAPVIFLLVIAILTPATMSLYRSLTQAYFAKNFDRSGFSASRMWLTHKCCTNRYSSNKMVNKFHGPYGFELPALYFFCRRCLCNPCFHTLKTQDYK